MFLKDRNQSDSPTSINTTQRIPRRRLFRSLRWRLSLWYVGLLTVLLLGLSIVLLITVSRLLYTNSFQSFQDQARASTISHHAAFLAAISHRDNNGTWVCSNFTDAFQMQVIDSTYYAITPQNTALLIDPRSGIILAPSQLAGQVPVLLHKDVLSQLYDLSRRNWQQAILNTNSLAYRVNVNGVQSGVMLLAYDYRNPSATCPNQSKLLPAVVMIAGDFTPTQHTVQSFTVLLASSAGILFVLGLAIGVPLTGASLRRLSKVSSVAQLLAQGDLSQRIKPHKQRDEIDDLAQNFDDMADQLQSAFQAQKDSEQRVRQFFADVSHELRTPMTTIRGYLDILGRGNTSADELVHIVTEARGEADRMAKLVTGLVTLGRFDTGHQLNLEWTNIGMLAGSAVDQARLLAGERQVQFIGDGQGQLFAYIDADRIKQVVLILLDNALKYGRQSDDGWVLLALNRDTSAITITISDNGLGIAAEDIDHIFERFYRTRNKAVQAERTDERQAGSGLGLAIAQAIVRVHGGTLSVSSVLGEGTIFTIVLPVQANPLNTLG